METPHVENAQKKTDDNRESIPDKKMNFYEDINDKFHDIHAMLDASMREEGEAELEES